jgi:hypothetical protein
MHRRWKGKNQGVFSKEIVEYVQFFAIILITWIWILARIKVSVKSYQQHYNLPRHNIFVENFCEHDRYCSFCPYISIALLFPF